ncbi:MAG: DUF2784 domain-containing protein [bacterium]|nr:DUF2784 domain-containing protein [bacterium]
MYAFLDTFFIGFHSLIIVFNLFGWLWRKTRRANLVLLLLTAFSWFILGIWYGFGFCPCTEWHYQVRVKLGLSMPSSYIKFLLDSVTGLDFNAQFVDIMTLVFFLSALIASVYTNHRDWKNKKNTASLSKKRDRRETS